MPPRKGIVPPARAALDEQFAGRVFEMASWIEAGLDVW